jgi:hypothetical protein
VIFGRVLGVALIAAGALYVYRNYSSLPLTAPRGSVLSGLTDPFAAFTTGADAGVMGVALPNPAPSPIDAASPIRAPAPAPVLTDHEPYHSWRLDES